jgi:mannosyltransferase OCH1-like enzyme
MKIKILSGRDLLPRISRENHQNYCNKFNYEYIFETKSNNPLLFKWSQKVYWIIDNLKDCDYLFYLDDDTFFIRDFPLEDLIIESDYKDLIISKDWDNINNQIFESPCSGVILFKNSDFCKEFLREWLNPNYDEIYSNYKKEWLNIKEKGWLGNFNNDQDIFVYLSFKYFDHVKLWNHEKIGVFPHNIKDDTFLVHAPGLLANRAYIEGFKKINFDIKNQVYKWAGGNLDLPSVFKDKKLSIIIPTKDPPSELLNHCISSVKNITYNNFECIIVCCNILKEKEIKLLINGDTRFKYSIAKVENLHYQRMQGIEESTGYYIACLDSDDFVDPTFYEEVINNIERDNADMSHVYCLKYDLARKFVSSIPTKRAGFSLVWKKEIFNKAKKYLYKLPLVVHGEDSYESNIIEHFSKKIIDTITLGKYNYIIGIPTNLSFSFNKTSFEIKKRVWSQYIEKNLLNSLKIQYDNEEFSSQDILNALPYYKQLSEDEKQNIKSFILDPPEYTDIYELTEENIEEKMFSKYKEKFIHWIWLSNHIVPEDIENCIRSWNILYNNGWKIKKWNLNNLPEEVKNHSFVQSAIKAEKYASASDYIRLWILYNFGGIYLDSDCVCLKPFNKELLEKNLLLGYEDGNYIAGHFIGTKPGHHLIKKVLDWYDNKIFDESWLKQGPEPIEKNMPYTLPGLLTNLLKNEQLNIYPKEYFTAKNYATKETYVTENTYILHQYAASWLKDNSKKEFQINDFGFKNT